MNTDIRLSVGLPHHPKMVKLGRRLGAEGALAYIYLLIFTGVNRANGTLHGMNAEDIAIASQFEGDAEAFVEALVDLHLLARSDDGTLAIHDWAEHNQWAANAEARSDKARKASKARWDKRLGETPDARSNANGCSEHSSEQDQAKPQAPSSNPPSPNPSPSPSPSPNPSPTPMGRRPAPTPDSMAVTDTMRSWAKDKEIVADLDGETERFLDYHRARGSTFKDWTAAWRNWMRKAEQFRQEQPGNGRGAPADLETVFKGGL